MVIAIVKLGTKIEVFLVNLLFFLQGAGGGAGFCSPVRAQEAFLFGSLQEAPFPALTGT